MEILYNSLVRLQLPFMLPSYPVIDPSPLVINVNCRKMINGVNQVCELTVKSCEVLVVS